MKKKLALLMAAIMTVAMVPMTAFASTKLTAVDEVATAVGEDHVFTSTVELVKSNDQEDVRDVYTDADGVEVFDVESAHSSSLVLLKLLLSRLPVV